MCDRFAWKKKEHGGRGRNIRIAMKSGIRPVDNATRESCPRRWIHEPNGFPDKFGPPRRVRRGIFATYLKIFGRVCTGMYRRLVFRSSGIGGPTTAASSSAREQGLENLNFNCLPRPDGLRIRRKRIVVWEIVDSYSDLRSTSWRGGEGKKNTFDRTTKIVLTHKRVSN